MQREIWLVFQIFVVKVSLIDAYHCPFVPENGQEWTQDYKKGIRCILQCNPGYVPSGCHVIRKEHGTWNHDIPKCVEELSVSGKTLVTIGAGVGAGVGAVLAVPYALTALGFGAAGVTAGSVAAWFQGSATASGGVFAALQSAGAAGIAGTTKVAIATTASSVTGGVNTLYNFMKCERE